MADLPGNGFLLVLTQPSATMEDEFNAWYDSEHLPERMSIPGFLSGIRFVAVDGHPKYLAHYDTERPDTLESPAYNAVSGANFSPWTKRVTSRVIVDRRAGRQVWPGDATLEPAPRLRLLKVRCDAADAAGLVEVLRAATDASPGALSLMVFQALEPACFYAFVRMTDAEPDAAFFPRLGSFRQAVEQHVIFAPYDSRASAG